MIPDDLRVVLRRLNRSRGSALTIVGLLALVMAINACVFAVAYSMMWKPLPYPGQDKLVRLTMHATKMGMDLDWSIPYLDTIQRGSEQFSAVAGYQSRELGRADSAGNVVGTVQAVLAEPQLFPMLGARAEAGRLFSDDDARPGAEPVALVSAALWKSEFGGNPATLNQKLWLGGIGYRIVGVLPPSFSFPQRDVRIWLPLGFTEEQTAMSNAGSFGNLAAMARLTRTTDSNAARTGIKALVGAQPTLAAISEQIGLKIGVEPLRSIWLEDRSTTLISMMGAGLLVFAVTLANVYNLFVLRLLRRRQEFAVLEAVGATRAQRRRQIALECLLLVVAASALAVVLMPLGLTVLQHFDVMPKGMPQSIGLDAATALALLAMGAAAMIVLASTASVIRGQSVYEVLRQTGNGQTASASVNRIRHVLVTAQIALTFVLLFGTTLLVRSSGQLLAEDVGFRRDGQVIATLQSSNVDPDADASTLKANVQDWVQRVQSLPGVRHVALSSSAPFSRNVTLENFAVAGATPEGRGGLPKAYLAHVSADLPAALGLRILRGRSFSSAEVQQHAPVALIDDALAQRYFPGSDPQGRSLRVAGEEGGPTDRVIVGVVARARQRSLQQPDEYPSIYLPAAVPLLLPGSSQDSAEVVIRGQNPQQLAVTLQRQLKQSGLPLRLTQVMTMQQRIEETIVDQLRLNALLRILSGITLLLTAVGLYALLAHSVTMRQREFGVRQALGASQQDILIGVLRQGLRMLGHAFLLALPPALLLGALLKSQLHKVSSTDPTSLVGVALMLLAVGLVANAWPAYKASLVKPMSALRSE